MTAYLGENHATPLAVGLYGTVATACSTSFYLLRKRIACHHREDQKLGELYRRMGNKNLIAVGIYLAGIPLSWVFVPLALLLIAAPAAMCFFPDRHVETLHGNA